MKNIIISILLLCLFSLGYLLAGNPENEKKVHTTPVKKEVYTKFSPRKTETINKKKKNDFNIFNKGKEAFTKSSQTISPFSEVDIDDTKLTVKTITGVEPIGAIHINKNMLKSIHVGDALVLPEIDGISYQMEVTQRTVSANGNTSLNGSFSENGIAYHTMITNGTKSTLMSFSTPTGSYEVELLNGTGYIYLTADIENKKIDYSKSDVIKNMSEEVKDEE